MNKTMSFLMIASVILATGCSSIVTQGRKNVNFNSNPPGAKFTIIDETGRTVDEGVTPQTVRLSTGKPYFRTRNYTAKFDLVGYDTQEAQFKSTVSGWYFGNIVFGGLVGLVIVDPLTGAIYTLPKEVVVDMTQSSAMNPPSDQQPVIELSHLPQELHPYLVKMDASEFPARFR